MSKEPFELPPGDLSLRAAKLREMRRAKGYTQEIACDRMRSECGIHMKRTTLVAIEQGERSLRSDEVIALCRIYETSVHELLSDRKAPPEIVPQFRTAFGNEFDDTSPLGKAAEKLQTYATSYLRLQEIMKMPQPRRYPEVTSLPQNRASLELIAQQLAADERNRLGLGRGPLPDLRKLLTDEVGINIFVFRMDRGISGLFGYNPELGACIGINSNHPLERRNWSLAHEYGHFLTTRHDADVEWYGGGRPRSLKEIFADSFAKHFQMPDEAVNRKYAEATRDKSSLTAADVVLMADSFHVSCQAMTLRLENMGRLKPGTWNKLEDNGFKPREAQEQLGLKHNREQEPCFPARYMDLAAFAYDEGHVSDEQLVEILDCPDLEARKLLGDWRKTGRGLEGATPTTVELLLPLG
jgi:Zn-dependent peptidase ImmA (M78 family)/transcriptional regulator with XRE-family HTH domain